MKLVTYLMDGGQRPGLFLAGNRILDLAAAGIASSALDFIAAGASTWEKARRLADEPPANAVIDAGSVKLLAPIPRPLKNIFCVGRNYLDHVKEGAAVRGWEMKL